MLYQTSIKKIPPSQKADLSSRLAQPVFYVTVVRPTSETKSQAQGGLEIHGGSGRSIHSMVHMDLRAGFYVRSLPVRLSPSCL